MPSVFKGTKNLTLVHSMALSYCFMVWYIFVLVKKKIKILCIECLSGISEPSKDHPACVKADPNLY